MIRLSTIICAGIFIATGSYLYHVKYQTRLLDRAISQTNRNIEVTRDRAGVLRAEWTLMSDPERLAELADQFLKLNTVAPRQFTTLADLSSRLPAVRALAAPPSTGTTEEPTDYPVEPMDEALLPLPPPAPPTPPVAVVTATPAPTQGTPNSAAPRPQLIAAPVPRQSTTSLAPEIQTREPTVPPRINARGSPQPASQALSQPTTSVAAQPIPLTPMMVGSALGMARSIVPPPIPIAGQSAWRGDIQFTRGN
ncbi:MAG: hypothetical protein EXR05_09260 [Acetobacteraceae bacterium]|nr:hypothetical protein [Acetobacteraceae bacterium]MSP29377.1 hypothetical protein [Acetobacteraceae bacterium]